MNKTQIATLKIRLWPHAITVVIAAAVIYLLQAEAAQAQQFTARGIASKPQANVACIYEIERLRAEVNSLRDIRDQIFDCNNNNMVYSESGCTSLLALSASWEPSAGDPDELVFNDGTRYTVTRGGAGSDGSCPDGYVAE